MANKVESFYSALEAENFKIANQTLSKLITKKPDSVHYQLLSCWYDIVVKHDFEGPNQQTVDLLADPKNYNQLVNNEILKLILDIFIHSNHTADISKVYETLLKKQPLNINLINNWFQTSLMHLNVSALQKASFHLQKVKAASSSVKSSEKRSAVFTAAFSYYLAASSSSNPLEKQLFPKLGLKLLESLEPLKTDQEVFVKIKLLTLCNDNSTALSIIEKVLLTKKFNEVDLSLVLIYVELLSKTKKYDQLYSFTHDVIFNVRFDDYNFWNYLILAAFKTKKEGALLKEIYSVFVEAENLSRNVSLVLINYGFLTEDIDFVKINLIKYFSVYGSKKSAYADLVKYVKNFNKLATGLESWFVDDLLTEMVYKEELGFPGRLNGEGDVTIQQVTKLVNIQKFMFLLNEKNHWNSAEGIQEYIELNTKLYNYAFSSYLLSHKEEMKNDYFVGNELMLLNLQVLLTYDFSVENVIKQVVILKHILSTSPQDFLVKVWLIKLYNYLNLPNLALLVFQTLGIKNVQLDTLSHYLSTRLTTRYPEPHYFNSTVANTLKFHTREVSMDYLIFFTEKCYEDGSYTKIEKNIEFLKKIESSYEKYYSLYEDLFQKMLLGQPFKDSKKRNFDYLNIIKLNQFNNVAHVDGPVKDSDTDFPNNWVLSFNTSGELDDGRKDDFDINYSDNRDYDTQWTGAAGHVIPILESNISTGPKPGEHYLRLQNLKIWLLALPTANLENEETKSLFAAFMKLYRMSKLDQFTRVEQLELHILVHFWQFVSFAHSSKGKNNTEGKTYLLNLKENLNELIALFKTTIGTSANNAFTWEWAHNYIVAIATYKQFNRVYDLSKKQFPTLFNHSSPFAKDIAGSIVANLQVFGKLIRKSYDEQALKQTRVKTATWLSKVKEQFLSDSTLKQIGVKGSLIEDVFESLKDEHQKVVNVLNKL